MDNFDISIINNQSKFEINIQEIEVIASKMTQYIIDEPEIRESSVLENIDLSIYSLGFDIVFSDDEQIEALNLSYRDKNNPTDVLSFALFADNPDENFVINKHIALGEIIISVETAKKQADEENKTFEEELYFLLSHGILHLMGFDHPDEGTLEDMLSLQAEMTDFAAK